jgi:hypothetical protein
MKTKFLNNIEAKLTGRNVPLPNPLEYISTQQVDILPGYAKELRVAVTLQAVTYIQNSKLELSPDNAKEVILNERQKIGREIAHHVYGDLRNKLLDLSIEIRKSQDYSKSLKSIEMIHEIIDMIEY